MQFYRYFVSQSSEFCLRNPLCCFSKSNTKSRRIFRYRLRPETFGYTLVYNEISFSYSEWPRIAASHVCVCVSARGQAYKYCELFIVSCLQLTSQFRQTVTYGVRTFSKLFEFGTPMFESHMGSQVFPIFSVVFLSPFRQCWDSVLGMP
jgi:hypothetical protein